MGSRGWAGEPALNIQIKCTTAYGVTNYSPIQLKGKISYILNSKFIDRQMPVFLMQLLANLHF
ncbi:hypothetical protein Q5688_19680, partial [Microcoleus sp. herbarium5]